MDQILDLRPMLQEQILLALPLTPLCSDDCQGPIPEEYPARSKSQQEGNHNLDPPIDPRWEALGSLTVEAEEINYASCPDNKSSNKRTFSTRGNGSLFLSVNWTYYGSPKKENI